MNQLLSFKMRNAIGVASMLLVFFLAGSVDANAQAATANGTVNPYAQEYMQKYSISAAALQTYTDLQDVIAKTAAIANPLKQLIADGTATAEQRFRYQYCQFIIADVRDYYMAPEIAALLNLEKANSMTSGMVLPPAQVRNVYEQVVGSW